ncbi:uncharacterized protein [Diabrotica undecimpunctata]|uniref:uncharacterized protein n=1 Tax=Diabrotica undecimpunctata TaxID=50387 RepID=UPI003B631BA4
MKGDCDFLKFLWVDTEGQTVVFSHKRVVFGVNSSPFLLGMTLEYHLARYLEKGSTSESLYTLDVVKRLSQSFYVDNCVTSLPDEEMVSRFITESVAVMAEGQFELRGWERTRNAEVSGTEEICPVLGMNWHPVRDVLTVNLKFLREDTDLENMVVTKRRILSIAQKVFDPIGYLCPALLVPKLMLQKLWEKSLAWDEPLDEVISEEFKIWLKDLPYLEKIELPRWVHMNGETLQNLSIHIFCDASKLAYACAIFLRVSFPGKDGSVRLCKVKTAKGYLLRPVQRLYPLKCCTVPEFELQNDVKTSMKDDSELNGTPHVPELAARDSSSEDEYCESAGVFKVSIPTNSAKVSKVKITRTGTGF